LRIKAVVSDVDGTLLSSKGTLSNFSKKVIKDYLSKGGHLILATGKLFRTIYPICKEFSLTSKQITVNGAIIVDPVTLKAEVLSELSFSSMMSVINILKKHKFEFVLFKPENIYYEEGKVKRSNLELLMEGGESPPVSFKSYRRWNYKNTVKILSFIPKILEKDEKIIREEIKACCKEIEVIRTSANFLEFLKKGTSKYTALKVILDELGIDLESVIAFGDQENDRELVEKAKIGVAVANASPKVKEVADYITESNNHDGVANFIQKFVLSED